MPKSDLVRPCLVLLVTSEECPILISKSAPARSGKGEEPDSSPFSKTEYKEQGLLLFHLSAMATFVAVTAVAIGCWPLAMQCHHA